MALDILVSRHRQVALLERYGALLNEHQREILDLHLQQDWSLAEIAKHQGTSRAAVHDLIRRAGAALEDADQRLGLLEEERDRREALGRAALEVAELRRRLEELAAELGRI